ncbi:MAG: TonB-dependent receptor [Alphaproteobacteria bacterium]|nr:TonB-dependent receptor [Alphaproteobacteria bacterium]
MKTKCNHIRASILLSASLVAFAGPALAAAPAPKLEEVIVTAQKRAQNMQKVGIALSAIGAQQLSTLPDSDVTAIVNLIPSVQFNQYSPTLTVFNIRGISQNDFADSQESPIAFYADDVYVSAMGAIAGQMYDLSQIAVLRGPQGTLFGRNATGGVIQVTSAAPTNYFSGYLQATGGSFGEYDTEGAISGPLGNSWRGRLSFQTIHHDGYIKNLIGPDVGSANSYAGRLQLEGDVGHGGDLLIKLWGIRNDHEVSGAYSHRASYPNADGLGVFVQWNVDVYGTCPGCDAFGYKAPGFPFTGSFDRKGLFDRTYGGLTVKYTQAFQGFTLTSITNMQVLRKRYGEDSDMSPNPIFIYDTHQYLLQESQETRLDGQVGRLHWTAGVYLLDINSRNNYDANVLVAGENIVYQAKTDTYSAAGFAQLEYALNNQFKVIGGFRYSWDHKKYWYATTDSLIPSNDFAFNPSLYPDLASRTYHPDYSYRVELDYTPTDNTLLYASINRGTKAGGFATPSSPPPNPAQLVFGQEALTSYEAGFKLTLFDDTTRFNGSVFHYDYHNYQAYGFYGLFQQITNNQAYDDGLELELTTTPVNGLVLHAFGSFLSTQVKNLHLPAGTVKDRVMPQAPHFSGGLSGQYTMPLAAGGDLTLSSDWKYNGTQFLSVMNAPVDKQPAYVVGNVQISYVPSFNNNLELSAFVNNVTDQAYRIYNLDLSGLLTFNQGVFAPPRWYGVTLRYNF